MATNDIVPFSSLTREQCIGVRARLTATIEQAEARLQTLLSQFFSHESSTVISEEIGKVKAGLVTNPDLAVLALTVLDNQLEIAKRKSWLAGVVDRLNEIETGSDDD